MMAIKAAPAVNQSSTPSLNHSRLAIASSALERLHQSPYRGLRSVALDLSGDTMILTGQVRTFFLKQMAQHLLGDFSGSWEIRNELRVA